MLGGTNVQLWSEEPVLQMKPEDSVRVFFKEAVLVGQLRYKNEACAH